MTENPNDLPPDRSGTEDPDPSPADYSKTPPDPGTGDAAPGTEEREVKDISEYTDEELDALLEKAEREQIDELTGQPGKYKDWSGVTKRLRQLEADDTRAYNRMNALAMRFKMTVPQLLDHLERQTGGAPSDAAAGGRAPDKADEASKAAVQQVKDLIGGYELRNLFRDFRLDQKEQGVDIPLELRAKLDKFLVAVTVGMSKEDLEAFNPYPDAYELYLFKLQQKGKSLDEIKEEIDGLHAAREKKRRQLGVPTKRRTPAGPSKEDEAVWGKGIRALPSPK